MALQNTQAGSQNLQATAPFLFSKPMVAAPSSVHFSLSQGFSLVQGFALFSGLCPFAGLCGKAGLSFAPPVPSSSTRLPSIFTRLPLISTRCRFFGNFCIAGLPWISLGLGLGPHTCHRPKFKKTGGDMVLQHQKNSHNKTQAFCSICTCSTCSAGLGHFPMLPASSIRLACKDGKT